MTKEEFYSAMQQFYNKHFSEGHRDVMDVELFHIEADDLMCQLLIELGYDKGVEIFLDAPKWYA